MHEDAYLVDSMDRPEIYHQTANFQINPGKVPAYLPVQRSHHGPQASQQPTEKARGRSSTRRGSEPESRLSNKHPSPAPPSSKSSLHEKQSQRNPSQHKKSKGSNSTENLPKHHAPAPSSSMVVEHSSPIEIKSKSKSVPPPTKHVTFTPSTNGIPKRSRRSFHSRPQTPPPPSPYPPSTSIDRAPSRGRSTTPSARDRDPSRGRSTTPTSRTRDPSHPCRTTSSTSTTSHSITPSTHDRNPSHPRRTPSSVSTTSRTSTPKGTTGSKDLKCILCERHHARKIEGSIGWCARCWDEVLRIRGRWEDGRVEMERAKRRLEWMGRETRWSLFG